MSHKVRIRAAAILIHEDKILLNEFDNGKYYNFPGGGLEANETLKQAVAREVMEEAGLTIEVGDLVFTLEYEPKSSNCKHGESGRISMFFRCYLNTEMPPKPITLPDVNPDDPSVISKAKWIPISEISRLNTLVSPVNEQLINYIKTGSFVPSFVETHILEAK